MESFAPTLGGAPPWGPTPMPDSPLRTAMAAATHYIGYDFIRSEAAFRAKVMVLATTVTLCPSEVEPGEIAFFLANPTLWDEPETFIWDECGISTIEVAFMRMMLMFRRKRADIQSPHESKWGFEIEARAGDTIRVYFFDVESQRIWDLMSDVPPRPSSTIEIYADTPQGLVPNAIQAEAGCFGTPIPDDERL